MDEHRIVIRRSAENVWLNLFQSLLTFTIFLTLFVGVYQLVTNLLGLISARSKTVKVLYWIYWFCVLIIIVVWLMSELIFGHQLFLHAFLIPGILLSFYSCFIRYVEYRSVKEEHLPFVIPYTQKEEICNSMADKRQIYYGHIIITVLGVSVYLASICVAYLLVMDVLLYKKTKSLETKKHLRSLGYLAVFLSILGCALSYLPMVENYLFVFVAVFVVIVGVNSCWIRYQEYQNEKNNYNSLF